MSDPIQSTADLLTSFGKGGFLRTLNSQFFARIFFFVRIGIWIAVILAVCWYVYIYLLEYNKKVRVVYVQGDRVIDIKHDKAKEMVDSQGKRKLQLRTLKKGKLKLSLPVPESNYKFKSGGTDYYDLWVDDNAQLHPIEYCPLPEEERMFVKRRAETRDAWAKYEKRQLEERLAKKDGIDKWMPTIIVFFAIGAAVLIMFFMFKEMGQGMSQLASAFQQVSSSCTAMR